MFLYLKLPGIDCTYYRKIESQPEECAITAMIYWNVISGRGSRMKENEDGFEVKPWTGVLEKEQIWERIPNEFSFS